MDAAIARSEIKQGPPLFVVSGGTGASGELLARTVLAQFTNVNVPIEIIPHVHAKQQVADAVSQAAHAGGAILHTMVNQARRCELATLAQQQHVPAFDLAGDVLGHLAHILEQEPAGEPGLYRRLHAAYFQRIAAIEFAVAHDDGKRIEELFQAEIVLLGVSRVGKTPLSMYLSILGWQVANVPLLPNIDPPAELFQLPANRVFGLTIEPNQLLQHRKSRRLRLGVDQGSYFDRQQIAAELRAANHLFYKCGFGVIDVTDKPIEATSDEIIDKLA
ncbi:MAG: pyruvate, water dikinase regulatory protein [Caldilineaceae bacterium]